MVSAAIGVVATAAMLIMSLIQDFHRAGPPEYFPPQGVAFDFNLKKLLSNSIAIKSNIAYQTKAKISSHNANQEKTEKYQSTRLNCLISVTVSVPGSTSNNMGAHRRLAVIVGPREYPAGAHLPLPTPSQIYDKDLQRQIEKYKTTALLYKNTQYIFQNDSTPGEITFHIPRVQETGTLFISFAYLVTDRSTNSSSYRVMSSCEEMYLSIFTTFDLGVENQCSENTTPFFCPLPVYQLANEVLYCAQPNATVIQQTKKACEAKDPLFPFLCQFQHYQKTKQSFLSPQVFANANGQGIFSDGQFVSTQSLYNEMEKSCQLQIGSMPENAYMNQVEMSMKVLDSWCDACLSNMGY